MCYNDNEYIKTIENIIFLQPSRKIRHKNRDSNTHKKYDRERKKELPHIIFASDEPQIETDER